ncbi:MAG TPA: hypothetical protein VH208_04615 [Myxococcaceae bacterium]|nr:hypothetical protein [Myxococcaceae bacterium]
MTDQFAVLGEAQAAIHLTVVGFEAAKAAVAAAGSWEAAVPLVLADEDVQAAWRDAGEGAQRDVLSIAAQLAAQAHVQLDYDKHPDAIELLGLAAEELGGPHPPSSLAAASPIGPPSGPTNIYASSYVYDREVTWQEKLTTFAVLATSQAAASEK